MNSPLRLYLMTRRRGADWKIFVSQKLNEVEDEWARQFGDGQISGVLHVGFGRLPTRAFNEAADGKDGWLLVTQGAKFVLPQTFSCSEHEIAQVEGLPIYLALDGWGYSREDPTLSVTSHSTDRNVRAEDGSSAKPARGWVSSFLSVAPEFDGDLKRVGVYDEESYIELEEDLPHQIRTALGQFRYDALIRDEADPLDIVRCAPPWLRSQPVTRLSLTVRLGNVFSSNGINLVSDLDGYTEAELFRLKNFGRHSKKHLSEALLQGLKRGTEDLKVSDEAFGERLLAPGEVGSESKEPPALLSVGLLVNLLKTLNQIDERDRNILLNRMGFSQKPRTLEDIGSEYGVTRERIRQIEKRSLERIIEKELWDDVLRHRLGAILDDRNDPLPLFGLEVVDEWFRGTADKQDVLEYLIDVMCEKRFHVLKVGEFRYVSRVEQEAWEGKLKEARQLLEGAVELNWSEAECRQTVDSFLPAWGKELAPLLWAEASRLCHFSGSDGARTLTAYGRGLEQLIQVVLEESSRPLHTSEVAKSVGDLSGKQVDEQQIRNPVANVGVLLGRGIYGLRKHVPLSDLEIETVAEVATEIVAEHSSGRQWHTSELLAEVLEIEGSLSDRLDKYGLSVALQMKSQLKYLGRLVWVLPDADDLHRVDIRDAVVEILDTAGGPLTSREINERLSKIRGLNGAVQIWNRDPVLRVGRGIWGLNDRDLAVKREEQPALIDRVFTALRQKGSGIHLDEIDRYIDGLVSVDPEAVFSIATLDDRIAVSIGRFAYLKEWGEPRRITLNAALEKLINQVPGPMNIGDIKDWLNFFTERQIDKEAVSHALSRSGTRYLGDGIWDLERQVADDSDDD